MATDYERDLARVAEELERLAEEPPSADRELPVPPRLDDRRLRRARGGGGRGGRRDRGVRALARPLLREGERRLQAPPARAREGRPRAVAGAARVARRTGARRRPRPGGRPVRGGAQRLREPRRRRPLLVGAR